MSKLGAVKEEEQESARNQQEFGGNCAGYGWQNLKGRTGGKTPRVRLRDEFKNAVNQVVQASAEGDVNASIAVLAMARAYDIK